MQTNVILCMIYQFFQKSIHFGTLISISLILVLDICIITISNRNSQLHYWSFLLKSMKNTSFKSFLKKTEQKTIRQNTLQENAQRLTDTTRKSIR